MFPYSNKEEGSGQNHNNIDYIKKAIPTMVPNAPKNEHKESSPSTKLAKPAKTSPGGRLHPLIKTKTLRFAAWLLSHNNWDQREYLEWLASSSPILERQELSQLTQST